MANVTFSSPILPHDVTVAAAAGDHGNLLAFAESHKVMIPHDCRDGECGNCIVEVTFLSKPTKAIEMGEKEIEMLKQLGKYYKKKGVETPVADLPPHYRLACQYAIRDEDVLVKFTGE
jgi:ferredoxin